MSILQTIQQAAAGAMVKLTPSPPPDRLIGMKHGALGTALPRIDGPQKVRGRARFAAEVAVENLTYAAVLHSSIARGRMTNIETQAAESAPGVVLVMTYRNAPRMQRALSC